MKRFFLLMANMRNAIKAETFCRKQGITCEVVPVPRQISSECGMCLEVSSDHAEQVLAELQQAGFEITLAQMEG